ncbi:capsule biosynthesis protein [Tateyamaria sp. Alg231-49]|uniref:capsule biosynthesis protein n=1 Tax=Tateyamaria sp. Alg231-49 TaxID=1922219 RepID=UPI001F2DACA9|nr:capsule biosynthesis protein [Tateyamaria sp. Alg231-49]
MAQISTKTAEADVEYPTQKPRVLRAKQRTEATFGGITSDTGKLSAHSKPAPTLPAHPAEVARKTKISAQHTVPSPAPARRAQTRGRHRFLALSFILFFAAPVILTAYYLWTFAADQYASNLAFSVRSEEQGSAIELLGGVTELSGSSTADTDILFAYLTSQELVSKVDDRLDLAQIWSKVTVNNDPFFAYDPSGTIEDLLAHWQRKISIIYDSGTRLIDVQVLAFDPADAQAVAQAVVEESTAMINALSDTARDDAIKYAREELVVASTRLKEARQALTLFRNRTQIVDPDIDTRNQMGVLVTLQQQLADALIDFDLLQDTTRSGDPRIVQATRRVDVIQKRIDAERRKLGLGAGAQEGVVFADLVGEYEGLIVDREFAEAAYTSALATHDAALAEARRQSRYLAAHIRPTLAQQAEYPQRLKILLLVALCSFLGWSILSLVFYSLRDRR